MGLGVLFCVFFSLLVLYAWQRQKRGGGDYEEEDDEEGIRSLKEHLYEGE